MLGPVPSLMVGATLLTTRSNEAKVVPPAPSVAVTVTVCDWAGPSVVANDHDQVLSAFCTMAPTETDKVVEAPLHSPVLLAVWPSLTATDAKFAATGGGAALLNSATSALVKTPL
jgi:hypothetical protein